MTTRDDEPAGSIDRILSVIDDGLADPGQRSLEPAYRLPENCWRCLDRPPVSELGLCQQCRAQVRHRSDDERALDPAPVVDPARPLAESLAEFSLAIGGESLYRSRFVHGGEPLRCETITIGVSRFPVDPPVVLEPEVAYVVVVDRESGRASIEPDQSAAAPR